jgi:MoaA/NifB/PqqE/SkfB family radical SAM enzyme
MQKQLAGAVVVFLSDTMHNSLSAVHVLRLELTTHCDAHCPQCSRFTLDGRLNPFLTLEHLDLDLMINNLQLDKLSNLNRVWIDGEKGEAIMHPNLLKLLDAFELMDCPPEVNLVTNGHGRPTQWWQDLAKKYNNLIVTFSIDGLSDTYNLYKVGLDYKTTINNATYFIQAGGKAVWKYIRFRHNQHQVEEARAVAQSMGFYEFTVINCDSSRFYGLDRWPVQTGGVVLHLIEKPSIGQEYNVRFKTKIRHQSKLDNASHRLCPWFARGEFYITSKGYVLPCSMMHYDLELPSSASKKTRELMGDIEQHDITVNTLEQIFNSDFFRERLTASLANKSLHPTCEKSCKQQINQNRESLS